MFDSCRGSVGVRRYRHDERSGEEIATSFRNDTSEMELLAHHGATRTVHGAIGASVLTREFEATAEEVLAPLVDQGGYAVYVYEEALGVDTSVRWRNPVASGEVNVLKDLAPEMGRNFALVYNVKF